MIANTFLYQFIEILSINGNVNVTVKGKPFCRAEKYVSLTSFIKLIIFVQVFVFVLVCVFYDLWWEVVNCSLLESAETGYRVVTPYTWQCFL